LQQFVERLNDLNRYLLYFPEENPKQLDQDEIIEILDQAKAMDTEWHQAMVNANFDTFEMTYEESVSYFKRKENFEKIRHTNGPSPSSLPVDNKKSVTSIVGKSSKNHKGPTCGVTTRTTTTWLIAERLPNLNCRKRLALKPKLDSERSLWPSFSFSKKLMHSKGN
jgi:HD superfamily phosphohydrolase